MEEGKGKCPHGEFDLRKGCPECVAERRAEAEVNSPENISERIEAVQPKPNIVKVQYYSMTTGELSPREYTYYSADQLEVGDIVIIPVRDTTGKAKVSAVGVAEAEIANFKDKVKTIPACSVIPPEVEFIPLKHTEAELEMIENRDKLSFDPNAWRTGAEEVRIEPGKEGMEGTAIVKVDPSIVPSFAKHLEEAKRIVEIASSRQIVNEADAKAANDDLNVMAELRKAVDAERKTFTSPLNEYLSVINGSYKLISAPLEEAYQITRKLLTAYKVEQQRKAAEAEKLNQDAIDLARRQAEANNGEFTVETKPVTVPFAPKLTRTDQGKSGLVDNWKFRIVDLEKLPREYMVPDEAMLNSIAKRQHDKKQVPGVEFYNEPGLRVSR